MVSIITTTGFGTSDIASEYFGEFARQLFMVMMVIGGCVGSTGGGIKVLRVVILTRLIQRETYRQLAPAQAVNILVVDGGEWISMKSNAWQRCSSPGWCCCS